MTVIIISVVVACLAIGLWVIKSAYKKGCEELETFKKDNPNDKHYGC